jgi:hypothetical protein
VVAVKTGSEPERSNRLRLFPANQPTIAVKFEEAITILETT